MSDHTLRPPLRPGKFLMLLVLANLAACTSPSEVTQAPVAPPIDPELLAFYAPIQDGGNAIPAVPVQYLSGRNKRQVVDYWTEEDPGTIIVDPFDKFL